MLRPFPLSIECCVLMGLALGDLLSTVWFVHVGQATEANRFLSLFLAMGLPAFILVKLAFIVLPLIAVDRARFLSPRFICALERVAIAGYLIVYAAGSVLANR